MGKQQRLDNVAKRTGAFQAAADALKWAVYLARQDGASWTEIGEATSLTRQGAQQRFGAYVEERGRHDATASR